MRDSIQTLLPAITAGDSLLPGSGLPLVHPARSRFTAWKRFALLLAALTFGVISAVAGTDTVAYDVPVGTKGNQGDKGLWSGNDFYVVRPILVRELGVFDHESDGIKEGAVLTVQIFARNGQEGTLLESLSFDAVSPGELRGGQRFRPLAQPLLLFPGAYSIIAGGFDPHNPRGNAGNPPYAGRSVPWTCNDGGGLIRFEGGGRYGFAGPNQFPPKPDKGPVNRYAAGTFTFAAATFAAAPAVQAEATNIPAATVMPVPPIPTHWLPWSGGMAALVLVGGVWYWSQRRRRARSQARVGGGLMAADSPDAAEWQFRALEAERRVERAHEAIRAGMVSQVSDILKENLVRNLVSQRHELIEAQRAAALELQALERRLDEIQAPLQERIRAYEARIAELEAALAAKDAREREVVLAKIAIVRRQLETERAKGKVQMN